MALLLRAGLGADPWTVFTQGIAEKTGWSPGTVLLGVSVVVFALWIPLRQRPGVGTVANALCVGPFLDVALWALPTPHGLPVRVLYLLAGVLGIALATGLYVGVGWGPGPRDGLMTGLAHLGLPLAVGRTLVEVSVLAGGWLLGGTVGPGTVLFMATIGPLVGYALPRLTLTPAEPRASR
ncbi:YczE/YyaS/YitT family protein [Streptomyces cacaoi]|uniref:YczE/YyaS/YitT family protein n=1 Tax=Streptomyces cacaoi TaxID=1898 RepID=UPI0033327760